jgi:hypothetical protein
MESENDWQLSRLLQLKRCERPDGRFWEQFDAQFHARRLSMLVKKNPLEDLGKWLRRIARPAVTLGGVMCVGLLLWNTPSASPTFSPGLLPQEFLMLTLEMDGGMAHVENEFDYVNDTTYVTPCVDHGGGNGLIAYNF